MRISARTRIQLTSDTVTAEIDARLSGRVVGPISDCAAVTIATYWQSSGSNGRAFAEFASTGEVDASALLSDIGGSVRYADNDHDAHELLALFAWVTVQQAAQADEDDTLDSDALYDESLCDRHGVHECGSCSEHTATTSDGWTCNECGGDVNGSGVTGESLRHV